MLFLMTSQRSSLIRPRAVSMYFNVSWMRYPCRNYNQVHRDCQWNLLPFIKSKLFCLPKCAMELIIKTPSEKDTGVLPCKGQEIMRIDGKETDQVTSRMPDPESFVHDPEDGTDEISRSDVLLERSNHGPGAGAEISRSQALLESRDEDLETEVMVVCQVHQRIDTDALSAKRVVHEKCVVDSQPVYDDAGNFYCSLCAFSCVSAEYLQSQEEVAKVKKKLVSFLSLMSVVNKKKSIEGLEQVEKITRTVLKIAQGIRRSEKRGN